MYVHGFPQSSKKKPMTALKKSLKVNQWRLHQYRYQCTTWWTIPTQTAFRTLSEVDHTAEAAQMGTFTMSLRQTSQDVPMLSVILMVSTVN